MNHTLDQFSDNPIIDELVSWPPRSEAVSSLRASNPLFRKPFVEITIGDETITRTFSKDGFDEYWAEAKLILETLTRIELISDLNVSALEDSAALLKEILSEKDESVAEAGMMFDNGMYQQYLWQFGMDYKDLPDQVMQNIATARAHLGAQ